MHLVGFITKKFVTMHGHMNVKSHIFFTNSLIFIAAEEDVSQYNVPQVNKFLPVEKKYLLSFFPVQTSSCLFMVRVEGYCCT